jgi:hypothetical protein
MDCILPIQGLKGLHIIVTSLPVHDPSSSSHTDCDIVWRFILFRLDYIQ